MKKLLLTSLGVIPLLLSAVSLEESNGDFKINSKDYTVALEKAKGYQLSIKNIGGTKVIYGNAVPTIQLDADWEKFRSAYNPPPEELNRMHLKPACKVIKNSKEEIQLEISWKFHSGTVKESITFNDTPAINYDLEIDHTVRLYSVKFHAALGHGGTDGIFLPDGKRAPGVWHGYGDIKFGKVWQAAWYPKKKFAVGIAIPDNGIPQGMEYAMQGKAEGVVNETSNIRATFPRLSNSGKVGKKNFKYTLLIANDPEALRAAAEKVIGKPKTLEIYSYESEKFLTAPGEQNSVIAQLRNNGTAKETVTLKSVITHGLNTKIKLADQNVTLNPGEQKEVKIPLTFTKDVYKGLAVTTELLNSKGEVLDQKFEICSVTDFSARDTLFGTVNAAQANKDGTETIWAKCYRKKYVGSVCYYCWAHSMIFGLIPPTDPWIPRTEANYTAPISKRFLKGFIDTAHAKGVKVYAMLTGLWNYDVAESHPEWIQYCKDGQPWIYNGTLYKDGTRRTIVKANAFTEERAAAWGNQMADCIDEFGFDGCRWDWNFIPDVDNDPLHAGEGKNDWYDNNGVPSKTLYPDPDTTAQKALAAWRKAVNKRHPNFIYGTNYTTTEENISKYPKYFKEATTNSLILMESMLSYANDDKNTFEKWANQLVEATDKVRVNGGTVVVGWMRGTNPGTVAYELANYVSSSAGAKWFQSYQFKVTAMNDIIRNRYFARYAEYYYSCDFLKASDSGITLASKDRILWKPFVRERKTKDGYREIVLPLINLPKDDFICQYHDTPELKNPVFAIQPKKGEKIDSVWVMDPLSPVEAKQIEVKGNQFKIKDLKESVMVLVRMKGK